MRRTKKYIQTISKSDFHIKTEEFDALFSMKGFGKPVYKYEDKISKSLSGDIKMIYVCDMLYALLYTPAFENVDTTKIKYYLNAAKNEAVIKLIYDYGLESLNPEYIDRDNLGLLSNQQAGKDIIRINYDPADKNKITTVPAFVIAKRFSDTVSRCVAFYKEGIAENTGKILPVDKAVILRKYSTATDYFKKEEPYITRWFYDYTEVFYDLTNNDIVSVKDILKIYKPKNFRTSKFYDAGQLLFTAKENLLKLGTYSTSDRARESYNKSHSINGCCIFIPIKNGNVDAQRLGYVKTIDNKLLFFNLSQTKEIIEAVFAGVINKKFSEERKVIVINATEFEIYSEAGECKKISVDVYMNEYTKFDMESVTAASRFELEEDSHFSIKNKIILSKFVLSNENNNFVIGEGCYFGNVFYMTKVYPNPIYRTDLALENIDNKGRYILLAKKSDWTEEMFIRALNASVPIKYKSIPKAFRTERVNKYSHI